MKNIVYGTFVLMTGMLFCLSLYSPACAVDKVVVIPLMGHAGKSLKNIITVARKNGDFTDPISAVNSISDASADNPYLIVIAPGVYTLSAALNLPDFVDIVGSGQNITTFTGARNDDVLGESFLVNVSYHSMLSNITVVNTGGGHYSTAIHVNGKIHEVSAITYGSTYNVGVAVNGGILENIYIRVTGGTSAIGIRYYGTFTLQHITIRSYGATDENYGVYFVYNTAPSLIDADIKVSGGATSIGIRYNDNQVIDPLESVRISSKNATKSYGIYDFADSYFCPVRPKRSTVYGTTRAIFIKNLSNTPYSLVRASQSTMHGGIEFDSNGNSGTSKCVACDDGEGNALGNDCQ